MAQKETIVLIGPIGAGKSTLGALLAQHLGRESVSLDALRSVYYPELGYDEAEVQRIHSERGFRGVYEYWKPFEVHSVERALEEHAGSVLDFGGGQSVHDPKGEFFARVRRALAPVPHVFLILPDPDPRASVEVLRQRSLSVSGWSGVEGDFDFHETFVRSPSNFELATAVIYTQKKAPSETLAEILSILGESDSASLRLEQPERKESPSRD